MFRFIFLLSIFCSSLFGDPLEDLFHLLQVSGAKEAHKEWHQKGERWTFQDNNEEQRDEILSILEEMGWFKAQTALKKYYDYGVVLGALQLCVKKRINYLIDEWNRGVRFDKVVFLTGKRPLHPQKEEGFSGTEADMMVKVWNQTEMPLELRKRPLVVIDAPPLPDRGRPTTESTLYAWLETNPMPGSALFFSSQPYIRHQGAIIKAVLPQTFSTETVGPAGGRNLPISVLLDTVAKWLYWEL